MKNKLKYKIIELWELVRFLLFGRSPHLLNKHTRSHGNACLVNEGRAITTHSFGLHICNKPKGVQTRRSIPNAEQFTTPYGIKTVLISLVLVCGIFGKVTAQQLPLYSQYYFNDYAVNPAVGGTRAYIDARSNHRYQWTGVTDAPRTYTLSVHGPMKKGNAGLGGYLFTDNTGPTRRTGAQFSYTYKFKITRQIKIALALSGGILEWKLDAQKIHLYDPNDKVIVNGVMRTLVPDAKAGFYIYHPKWYFGLSAPNLIPSKLKFNNALYTGLSRLETHFFATAGYKFRMSRDFKLEPALLVKYVNPAPTQLDIMARLFWKEKIWIGGVFRTMDAASVLVGVTYRQNLSFGYSYDFTTSNIRNYSSGTHELYIGLKFTNYKESEENDISDEFLKEKQKKVIKKSKLKQI